MQCTIQQSHALGLQLTVALSPNQNLIFYNCVVKTVIASLTNPSLT